MAYHQLPRQRSHLQTGFWILLFSIWSLASWAGNASADSASVAAKPFVQPSPPALPLADDLITTQLAMENTINNLERIAKAREAVNKALDLGNFLQKLDSLAWLDFPVVLGDTISNVPIHIVFDKLRLYPSYAELEVIVQIQLPQRTVSASAGNSPPGASEYVHLYFGTPSLKFAHDGGIIGETLLGLYAHYPIGTSDPSKFAVVLNAWHEFGQGANAQDLGTYVKIDCDGFVEMGIEADVMFSRDWIVPVDANDNPLSSGRVKGHVQTIVTDWQDFLVEISLPNFAPADFPEIAFNLSTAVFDFSDFRNSPNMVFPEEYSEQHLLPENPALWRGVYIKNLELSLPKQIKKKGCVAGNTPAGGGSSSGSGSGTGMLILDDTGSYAYQSDVHLENLSATGPAYVDPPAEVEIPPSVSEAYTTYEAPLPAGGCRIKVGVNDLLIDGFGVSGLFYAENVLSLDDGSMDGWKYSLTDLSVELVCSKVTGFGFGGNVTVPVQKQGQSFNYTAFINIPDKTYSFEVAIGQDYIFPVFKMAEVGILAGSYLNITVKPQRFEPVAVLYGYAKVKAKRTSSSPDGDDSQEESGKLSFQAAKLNFHGLKLATQGTKLSLIQGGYLSLENELTLLGFPLPVAEPKLTQTPGGVKLSFVVDLNLMNESDHGFAVSTDVGIMGAFQQENYEHKWKNAGMNISSIYVNISLPALKIIGYAHVFDDHEVYGRGFQGALTVDVGPTDNGQDPLVHVEINAMFGSTTFKYWYVDGFVEIENFGIPVIPGVLEINGFGGGAYYHMKMDGWDPEGSNVGEAGVTTSGVKYVPDQSIVLGLKATVAFRSPTETVDGVVTLELVFSGTGLQEIMFYGKAEIVSPKVSAALGKFSSGLKDRTKTLNLGREEQKAKDGNDTGSPNDEILATAFLRMNFEAGFEFQGTFGCSIDAAKGTIKASGKIDILISTPQNRWHLYVGGYNNNAIMASDGSPLPPITAQINLGNGISATATAYFLIGNDIPGPPPLHPQAAAFFGITSATANNRASLAGQAANGTGFAFGAALVANIEGRTRNKGAYSKNHFKFEMGAGFDVSLLKYGKNTYCSLSGHQPHGHKGWRATGRIWAYASGYAKWRGLNSGTIGVGLLIQADIPKPTYLDVTVKVELSIFSFTVNVDIGDECGPPYN